MAGENWINAHGGIGAGHHPLNLVLCDSMSTATGAQTCGTQFADNSSMVAVIVGGSPGESFYTAVAASHKPMLGAATFAGPADASTDLYQFYPGNVYPQAVTGFVKHLPNFSSLKTWLTIYETGLTASLDQYNLMKTELPSMNFSNVTISTTTADITPQLVAGHVGTADVVYASGNFNCGLLGTGAKALGVKLHYVILNAPGCVSAQDLASSPSTYAGWYAVDPVKDAAADPSDPESAQFLAAWAKSYPGKTYPLNGLSEWIYGGALTFQNITNSLSDSQLSSADITTAMANFKGPVSMGDQQVSCPTGTDQITCAAGGIAYQYTPAGKVAFVQYTSNGTVIVPGVNG
jgi:hypothetical protein